MKLIQTEIPDVVIIEPTVFGDERGFFMETWRESVLEEAGIDVKFVQENHSRSGRGTLRGLHYQIEKPQGKLVRVVRGEVFDVVVDIRKESETFGKWVGAVLSEENNRSLWVPPGFAHGFYVTSDSADFVYKCTDYYAPEFERSLCWDDPALDIKWPVSVGENPIVSEKDSKALPFSSLGLSNNQISSESY